MITYVIADGGHICATDGRRLILIKADGLPEDGTQLWWKDGKRVPHPQYEGAGKTKVPATYPNYKQVIPNRPKPRCDINVDDFLAVLNQALVIRNKDDLALSLTLWIDGWNNWGAVASVANSGMFAGGPADPNTAKFVGAYDAQFLKDCFTAARKLGYETLVCFAEDEISPCQFSEKAYDPDFLYVLMPMRGEWEPHSRHPLAD